MTRERHQPAPVGSHAAPDGNGPVRTCVGCRRTRPRDELVRLARTPDGVRYDRQRRAPGRGANLCPDPSCIEAASERGAGRLRRALRGAPETEIRAALDTLRRDLDDQDRQTPPAGSTPAPTSRPRGTRVSTPSAG
ncbi:DUF448 domain-containing protein [Nitriliruptor alkaliphilus]|uniref:DUF448 domain-containing protein n=1 Tax=Nitriliruptor alkaliphilus TaxID=427918 RepID=UPI0009F9C631